MSETTLSEASSFDRLLGLKITPDLKWNEYIGEVAKVAGKMVGSLFRSRTYLSPASILYLYKSQIAQRWNIVAIFGAELPRPLYPVLIEFNAVCVILLEMSFSPLFLPLCTDGMFQVFLCSTAITMQNVQRNFILLFLQRRSLQGKPDWPRKAMNTLCRNQQPKRKHMGKASYLGLLRSGMLFHLNVFQRNMTLMLSNQMLIAIYLILTKNLFFMN